MNKVERSTESTEGTEAPAGAEVGRGDALRLALGDVVWFQGQQWEVGRMTLHGVWLQPVGWQLKWMETQGDKGRPPGYPEIRGRSRKG